jgi:Wzt C-terminal domain
MAITVRRDTPSFFGEVPNGAIVGVIGDTDGGAKAVLRLAEKEAQETTTNPSMVLPLPFALDDAVARERGIAQLSRARRGGAAILLYSHDQDLIERLCDEVWWVHDGKLAQRGSPREVLDRYRHHVAARLAAESDAQEMAPAFRGGDGRAVLEVIETLGADGLPTAIWASGAAAAVRVTVRFQQAVADPVVGILIRTRVGLDVFGTNTQLEGASVGPVESGARREVIFRFDCALCPQEYTITAASHDPDGVWHDWMEDAVAITVTDTRYTAGVANLRARVEVRPV